MSLKKYKAYGKDKLNQRWKYIATIKGYNLASAKRTFKKMSRWPYVKLVPTK